MIQNRILFFPCMLVIFEIATYLANDMYLPGLPTLAQDLQISQDQAQNTLLFWFIGAASMQLFLGPISDVVGRKIVLLGANLLFIGTSLLCGITSNLEIMLLARFFQGMCICAIGTAGYGIIHELYDAKKAILIISAMGAVTILAPSLGPLVGAFVVYFANWRWIFYALTVLSIFSLIGLMVSMPSSKRIYAFQFKKILQDYKKIICNPVFSLFALTLGVQWIGLISWIVESAFIILQTHKKSELEYGIIQCIIFSQCLVGAFLTKHLLERISLRLLIQTGLCVAAIAAIGMVINIIICPDCLYTAVLWMMLYTLGCSLSFSTLNRCAVDACREPMGARMAVLSTYNGLFMVLATYLVTKLNDATIDNLLWIVSISAFASLSVWILGRVAKKI